MPRGTTPGRRLLQQDMPAAPEAEWREAFATCSYARRPRSRCGLAAVSDAQHDEASLTQLIVYNQVRPNALRALANLNRNISGEAESTFVRPSPSPQQRPDTCSSEI